MRWKLLVGSVVVGVLASVCALAADAPAPPFKYVWAKAYHIMPETHNRQSGYFSLSEGLDGRMYIGTAKYNVNAYMVEFDPTTERQRIVIDTNKVCGLTATGYGAQSKIHTRNFVGPSGKIYCGSKQGDRAEGDSTKYPGGYVVTYDPRTGIAESLGMPCPGLGVIDVVADEARGFMYIVTCEEPRWMVYEAKTKRYSEIGPRLCSSYASTLIDAKGRANAITSDFRLAQYDPLTKKLVTRDIMLDGKRFAIDSVPCWSIAADGRTAYLIQLNDPTLIELDLLSEGETVQAKSHGLMIKGKGYDSRGSLTIGPDGCVYSVVAVANQTGFGDGALNHLLRFDPRSHKMDDLGVIAVKNPDYYDWGTPDKPKPLIHGIGYKLPDGTFVPQYPMATYAARDGTIWVTALYPFTLLRIDDFKLPTPTKGAAARYLDFALASCDKVESNMPEITRVAEVVANRYAAGGMIGFSIDTRPLREELYGRSGGIVHVGFDRPWKQDRTDAEKANDVVICDFSIPPSKEGLDFIQGEKKRGCYIIGFGPRASASLAASLAICDAWLDTGLSHDDTVAPNPAECSAERLNCLINALQGWALTGEVVSALTRKGKMPTMWKSYASRDGVAWGDRYFHKKAFHDDYTVAPIPAGELARAYLDRMRYHLRRFERDELADVASAAKLVANEKKEGRMTVVGTSGHMLWTFVGRGADKSWAAPSDLHATVQSQMDAWPKGTPDGALVLRIGYVGYPQKEAELFKSKSQRVILCTSENTESDAEAPRNVLLNIDTGYAFGDSCVAIEGYPIRILPPSGVMQLVAYEAVNAEVLNPGL